MYLWNPQTHAHDLTGNHLLFVGIFSHRLNNEQRQAVRDSWLKFPLPPMYIFNFFILVFYFFLLFEKNLLLLFCLFNIYMVEQQ